MSPMVGERVRLRPAEAGDAERFTEIMSHPSVARWWADADWQPADSVRELLEPAEGTDTFAVVVDDEIAGVIQSYDEAEPQYHHAGIDIAIHPDWHGRGIGTDALRTLARHLIADRGHHRLVIDPAADNEVAIHTYRKIGFRPVGIMRSYERGADGTWHDNLLMDLLADELT